MQLILCYEIVAKLIFLSFVLFVRGCCVCVFLIATRRLRYLFSVIVVTDVATIAAAVAATCVCVRVFLFLLFLFR